MRKHKSRGLTLIEVMLSLAVILVILIGVVGYMYASMWNTRRAEIRITATRIGQMLIDSWKLTGAYDASNNWSWTVTDFDPTDATFNSNLPASFTSASFDLSGGGITGTELGDYNISIDNISYFVTLVYDNNRPNMLTARVGWNQSLQATTLQTEYNYVDIASLSIY